jgi:polysaccharide export outer membrane protein
VLRTENGKAVRLRFNYSEVARGKRLEQNVVLKPGDQVVVP